MIRRALWAVLWGAVLFGLGVAGLGWAGWLPWQRGGLEVEQPEVSQPRLNQPATTQGETVPARPLTPPQDEPGPAAQAPPLRPARPQPPQPRPVPAVPAPAPRAPEAPSSDTVPLARLNALRSLAGLPGVETEPTWRPGCDAHARYLVGVDRGEHQQDPDSPHGSPEGRTCAAGHYFVSSQPESGADPALLDRAVDYWATGTFHLPQLLDPRLSRVAFGTAHDGQGAVQSAAVLDVARGRGGPARYPVRFPAPDARSPYRAAARFEWPDPLPGCAAYQHPVGPPIALLLGPGDRVTGAALKVNGEAVAACLLTKATFVGASPAETSAGRGVLAAQGAALLLPRQPLPAGAAVKVSFSASSGSVAWSFQVR